tara:strand:+ start:1757 stop:2644 length:888 start_codon:yes stop_codon:yes gene_type:complete
MGIVITKPDYRGVELQDFLTNAFYKKNAVDRFTLLPNVKDRFGMNFLNFTGLVLGEAGCDFVPNVNTALTEKNLIIDTYDINFEECIVIFEQSYLADTLKAGANNVELPPSFEAWLLEKLPAKIADELERKCFSELSIELAADATVLPVTILPITITNAIDEIGKVYNAIPGELFGNPDLVIMMNYNMWKSYQQSAFDTSVPQLITDGITMTYLGIELVPAPVYNLGQGGGLENNVIIAGLMSNFVRATDLVSDDSTLSIIDLSKTIGDKKIRVTGRLKFKCTYGIGNEIVYATV